MTQFSSSFLKVTGGIRGGAGMEVEGAGRGHGGSDTKGAGVGGELVGEGGVDLVSTGPFRTSLYVTSFLKNFLFLLVTLLLPSTFIR